MNCIQRIQPYLRSNETCKYCIEGCVVNGWTRLPHFFAIVRSSLNNYGLVIFSFPGIGSTDTTIHPKYVLPISEKFKYTQAKPTNHFSAEIQLELTCGPTTYLAEFVTGPATQQFIEGLRELCNNASRNPTSSFEWLKKYNVPSPSDSESSDWPWSEITNLPSPGSYYTPIAFDADDDILSTFDPLATNTCKGEETAGELCNDLLIDYENIELATHNLNVNRVSEDTCTSSEIIDLNDFDPLSKEEIEGIKSEKMYETLKRSGNVVSNANRPPASNTNIPDQNEIKKVEADDEAFDVVDHSELQSSQANLYSNFLSANNSVMRARENFIKLHMAAREKDFTDLYPFTLFAGTWNVNGQFPSEKLDSLLQSTAEPPDILAIGFQELDLSAEAFVFTDSSRQDMWIHCIEKGLPPNYYRVSVVRLVGMMLAVYVHEKHKMHVHNVESETHGTGIMGMLGNKGGVAVRFQLYHSTICFVNSHLAAHLAEFERRNQDFNEVFHNLKFTLFQPPLNIADHNMVFWLGDLNYRFDELDVEEVKRLDKTGDYQKLNKHDQLNKQRSKGKTFKGFTETEPSFKPTYKYDPGTDEWDSSEKARAPAWCDRILWKGKNIEQLNYRSHPDLKLSDHKPVSAFFNVKMKVVDTAKERKVFEEIVRKLDKEENESLPQVKLSKQELSFGSVEFMEKKVATLPIANIGQRIVEFSFIPKLDEKAVSMPWFQINPVAGFIMAGDFTEIEIILCVNKQSAPLVAKSNYQLNDILVLHLVGGKDFFVPLSASYNPSVFGTSLQTLVKTYGAIRDVPIDTLMQLESSASPSSLQSSDAVAPNSVEPLEIPKEIWLLVDHLYKYGIRTEHILLQAGLDEEIIQIRNHLDSANQEGSIPGSIYSIGETLLLLLEALPEPVIPYKYHSKCLEACNNFVLSKQALNLLSPCHFNVFRYLCAFLRQLLKQCDENKLDAKMLATIFGEIFLRSPVSESESQNKRTLSQLGQKKARFVLHFLVNDFRC